MSTPNDIAPPSTPAPVLENRPTSTRGVWLPDPVEVGQRVWVPEQELAELVDAQTEDRWVQTPLLSQQEALIAAGLATQDGESDFLRGTDSLHQLLHPPRDERGGHLYDPAVHGPFYPGDPGTEEFDAQADAAGFLHCVGCGCRPVSYGRARYYDNKLEVEYDNALLVTLSGGYGMFFDEAPIPVAFCHDCAHDLCARYPGLAEVVRPERGHAHSTAYTSAHPEHVGWDTRHEAHEPLPQVVP